MWIRMWIRADSLMDGSLYNTHRDSVELVDGKPWYD